MKKSRLEFCVKSSSRFFFGVFGASAFYDNRLSTANFAKVGFSQVASFAKVRRPSPRFNAQYTLGVSSSRTWEPSRALTAKKRDVELNQAKKNPAPSSLAELGGVFCYLSKEHFITSRDVSSYDETLFALSRALLPICCLQRPTQKPRISTARRLRRCAPRCAKVIRVFREKSVAV